MGFSPTVSVSSTPSKLSPHFGYNLTNALTKYKSNMENVSSSLVKIHAVGDSVTYGVGSSGPLSNGWVDVLRGRLQNRYQFNDGNGFQYPGGFGGSWSSTNNGGIGLEYYNRTSTALTDFASVTVKGSTIVLYYCADATGGSASVTIDGATPANGPTTISCNNAGGFTNLSATYTGLTDASHTIKITASDTNHLMLCGAIGRGQSTGIELNKLGVSGSKASDWNNANVSSAWSRFCGDASLVLIALGYNDSSTSVGNRASTLSTYKTNMGNIITAWQNTGASVVLVALPRPNETWNSGNGIWWPEWVQAMYSLADQYNVGLIDVYQATMMSAEILTSLDYFATASQAAGPSGANQVHPSDIGHQLIARIIEPILVV